MTIGGPLRQGFRPLVEAVTESGPRSADLEAIDLAEGDLVLDYGTIAGQANFS